MVAAACEPSQEPPTPLPLAPAAYLAPVAPPLPAPVRLPAIVVDLAGSGEFGDGGDEGPALQAMLRSVGGVAADQRGAVYVADPSSSKVRRIQADGIIVAVAGTGVRGTNGDGGPAQAAQLTDPTRLTVDGAGTLFVAEVDRVRRIGGDGQISTVLGDGQPGTEGDGGLAVLARTAGNAGMAIDGEGNLFVAEGASHRVRRIDTDGVITTVAGTGIAGGGGDGGPATAAQLNRPIDVEVDGAGNVLIAELRGNRIRQIAPDGTISTRAGTGLAGSRGDGGPAMTAEFNGPQAVAVDGAGNIFVADWNNRRIRRIRPDAIVETVAGASGGRPESGGAAIETRLVLPVDLAATFDGSLVFAEQGTRRVRVLVAGLDARPAVTAATRAPVAYVTPGPAVPLGAAVVDNPVADRFAGVGEPGFAGDGGRRADAQFAAPQGIAVDAIGRVFVADTGNHRVRRIELDGTVHTVAGTGIPGMAGDGGPAIEAQLSRPAAVALDASGALFIADSGNFRVRRVSVDGVISTLTGGARPGTSGDGGPARDALLTEPTGLALDDRGRLYIADPPAHRVRMIESNGVIQSVAGTGAEGRHGDGDPATAASVGFPQRVAVDPAGRLLITQLHDGVVRSVSPDGTIGTLAGVPESGVLDTRPGAQARIDAPIGVAADREGHIYVVESGAGTIIRIGPDGVVTVIAGNPTGQGRTGDAARDVPLFTAVDIALAADGTAYVLEARGTIWRLGRPADGSPTEPSPDVTISPSPRPTIPPAADEFAEIETITLALGLDASQGAVDPTLEFHPGERVNISIEFANVREGSRLGIRWSAGDRALGTFLTDPQSAYGRATFGFFFNLGASAPIGRWRVEVLVGTRVAGVAEFAVTPGDVRVPPPQG